MDALCFLAPSSIPIAAGNSSKLSSSSSFVSRGFNSITSGAHLATHRHRRVTTICASADINNSTGGVADDASVHAPLVPILMGSASDTAHCEKISAALSRLGIASEMRIASAHKVPSRLLDVLAAYENCPRPKVYIAVAGRSNALSGVLDCAVISPVVSCPPYSETFGGADLFSSIRMPSGVAPALVLDPAGAALFAAKVFALHSRKVRDNIDALQAANRHRLSADDAALVARSYLPRISATRTAKITLENTDASLIFGSAGDGTERIQGKVRDRYEFDGDNGRPMVALVTTDRQSAFDRILATVPYKGAVLNLVSAWWFSRTQHIIDNHVISIPHANVTVAHRCAPFAIEFVVRGYITGSTNTSLWKNYSEGGKREYCGIKFPDGLVKNEKLRTPVLTPTTKSDLGDRPIAPADIIKEGIMSQEDFDVCANAAMKLFEYGQRTALENGLILVDTKYEFGRSANDGVIRLIDEIHTPDSSRYWMAASYSVRFNAGKEPENVDKEFLRLWFAENCDPYNTDVPLPNAPDQLVDQLSMKYVMLYELITGERFDFERAEKGPAGISQAIKEYGVASASAVRR